MNRKGLIPLLVLAVVVIGGCTPKGTTASDASTQVAEANIGPLDEFTMRIWGYAANASEAEMNRHWEQLHIWSEEATAACMADFGFSYVPEVDNSPQVIVPEGPLRGTKEYAEQFGFGISSGVTGSVAIVTRSGTANTATVNAMSNAERDAWNRALWGNLWEQDNEGHVEPILGCHELSRAAAFANDEKAFAEIRSAVQSFEAQAASSPTMIDLESEWANCMANLGFHGFPTRQYLFDTLLEEWREINGSTNDILLSLDWETWDWESFPNGPQPDELVPGRANFTEREIYLATLDYSCRSQLDFDDRRSRINLREQTAFVNIHRNELEAWASFAEARRAEIGISDIGTN